MNENVPSEKPEPAKGARVLVPKGTLIVSMHPRRPRYEAGRDHRVVVHHVLPEHRERVANRYTSDGSVYWAGNDKDIDRWLSMKGLPFETKREREESLAKLLAMAKVEETFGKEKVVEMLAVVLAPARVVWAGTGGYWCEADIQTIRELPSLPEPRS